MTVSFKGKTPRVHPDAFIAETTVLIGDVSVGKDSSVWFGAVVRADEAAIEIGNGSNVQDNATLHCDPGHPLSIGNNVTIGHNAVIHCASVGDNTLVGMGARLLDGAVIGKNCIIGAGAVVKERDNVPDGTMMVGVPAKAVKALPPDYIAALERQSTYVALSKEYME